MVFVFRESSLVLNFAHSTLKCIKMCENAPGEGKMTLRSIEKNEGINYATRLPTPDTGTKMPNLWIQGK